MRRYRRLVLIERAIPLLAAFLGLVALAGAVIVQANVDAATRRLAAEMAETRTAIEQLSQRAESLATAPRDDGAIEGLLALQDRLARVETALEEQSAAAEAAAAAGAPAGGETNTAAPAEIDPNLPVTDCIPLGTRFLVVPNDSYPLCQSTAVIDVGFISADAVEVAGAGQIVENGVGRLAGTTCTITVLSADAEGFAELRVTCTL